MEAEADITQTRVYYPRGTGAVRQRIERIRRAHFALPRLDILPRKPPVIQ